MFQSMFAIQRNLVFATCFLVRSHMLLETKLSEHFCILLKPKCIVLLLCHCVVPMFWFLINCLVFLIILLCYCSVLSFFCPICLMFVDFFSLFFFFIYSASIILGKWFLYISQIRNEIM